jgi:hypothetical protein
MNVTKANSSIPQMMNISTENFSVNKWGHEKVFLRKLDHVIVVTFLLLFLCGIAHEEVLCWLLPSQGKSLNLQGTECCLQG